MANKLTPEEIIKALECCKDFSDCDGCQYGYLRTGNGLCIYAMQKDALDLIKRQQEDNINLKGHLEQLKSRYDNAKAEIEKLEKTEIEIDDFCRRLCRMRMLNGNAIASYQDLQNYIQEEKFEAIKEFIKRLKLKANGYGFDGEHYEMVDVEDIDDTYEEMVGEDK